MKTITILPHIADIRLKLEADTLPELFEAGVTGMSNILKENFCEENKEMTIRENVTIAATDPTFLLVDFLSEVLTLSYSLKALFCRVQVKLLTANSIEAEIRGAPAVSLDEDIKAVTYHEAEVLRREDGKWETVIVFDI